jgi:hypothetical protein
MSLPRPSTFDLRFGAPAHDHSASEQIADKSSDPGLDLGHISAGVRAVERHALRPDHLDERLPLGTPRKEVVDMLDDGLPVYRLPTDCCSEIVRGTRSRFERLRVWRTGANGIERHRDRMTGEQYFVKTVKSEGAALEVAASLVARRVGFPQGLVRQSSIESDGRASVLVQHARDLYEPRTRLEVLTSPAKIWKASPQSRVAMHVFDASISNFDRHRMNLLIVGEPPNAAAQIFDHDQVSVAVNADPVEFDNYLRASVGRFYIPISLPHDEVRQIVLTTCEAIRSTPWDQWIPRLAKHDSLGDGAEQALRAFALQTLRQAAEIAQGVDDAVSALTATPDLGARFHNMTSWF